MGCWNETCMLTNLPIHRKDEVRVMFLVGNPYKIHRSYPTAYNHVIPFLFEGTYNDYGNIEGHKETALSGLVVRSLFGFADAESIESHLEERANPGFDGIPKDAPYTLSDLINCAQRHDMTVQVKSFLPNFPTTYQPVTAVMMRQDVLDMMIDDQPGSMIYEFVNEGHQWITEMLDHDDEDLSTYLLVSRFAESFSGADSFSNLLPPRVLLQQAMMERDAKQAMEIVESLATFRALDRIMNATRRVYTGQGGMGSQDDVTEEHRQLMRTTQAIADKIDRRWDEI